MLTFGLLIVEFLFGVIDNNNYLCPRITFTDTKKEILTKNSVTTLKGVKL